VCKYFEIPFTGSLLLCDRTHDDLGKLGFIDGVNCIMYNDQSDISNKIQYIFDNPQIVSDIRENGYYLIREKHLVSIRCQEIYGNMKKIKSKY
jgi:spore maturation protein CgeB